MFARFSGFSCIAMILTATVASAADWQPPKDNLVTDKQMTTYVQVLKEFVDNARAAGKAIEGSQSGGAALAIALRNDEKFKSSLASHGLSQAEFDWLANTVWQSYAALLRDDIVQKAQADLEQQKKKTQDTLTQNKTKLADYEKAQKQGRRVMSKEDRDAAIASAKSDQQSALEEAKGHAEEAATAQKDADKADADAKAADAAAKNPPADVSADDRPAFIDQKKSEAQSARDAAKDARDKVAEAKKAEAESRGKAASFARRAAEPDLAITDEEKAESKKQNDEQIASLQNEIKDTERGLQMLNESNATLIKSFQQQGADQPPAQNVELIKKHRDDFEKAWGIKK